MSNTMPNEKVQAFIVNIFMCIHVHVCTYVCIHVLVEKILKCKAKSINCPCVLFLTVVFLLTFLQHMLLYTLISPSLPLPPSLSLPPSPSLPPTPQVVITYVSYLCHQLLLLRREGRAAMVIQRAWRTHRRHWLRASEIQSKERAAITLQVVYGAVLICSYMYIYMCIYIYIYKCCSGTAIDLLDIYRQMACMNWVT